MRKIPLPDLSGERNRLSKPSVLADHKTNRTALPQKRSEGVRYGYFEKCFFQWFRYVL